MDMGPPDTSSTRHYQAAAQEPVNALLDGPTSRVH